MIWLAKRIFILFFLILFSFNAFADYSSMGDNDFYGGSISDNFLSDDFFVRTKSVSGYYFYPIIDDFDNDGIEEYAISTGSQIQIYKYNNMTKVASISSGCDLSNDYSVSNLASSNLDNDDYIEIVQQCREGGLLSDKQIHIYEYNGSAMTLEYDFTRDDGFAADLELFPTVACDKDRKICGVAGVEDGGVITTFQAFNSTYIGTSVINYNTGSFDACMPYQNTMTVADYDSDGIKEFIYGAMYYTTTDKGIVFVNKVGPTLTATEDLQLEVLDDLEDYAATGCQNPSFQDGRFYMSAPYVYDWDIITGLEIAVAYMRDVDTYKMSVFDYQGNELYTFPNLARAGEILSNPFPANIIYDSGTDVCIFAYDSSDNEIDLLCGNDESSYFQSEVFSFDISGYFNMETLQNISHVHTMTVHASDNEVQQGYDPDEILTSYGIFNVKYNSFIFAFLDNKLEMLVDFGINKSMTSVANDFDGNGYSDIIGLGLTNLYYIDDEFINRPASIRGYNISPCNPIQVNESVWIRFYVDDLDDDNVYANATIYQDDINQQDAATQTGLAGSEFSFLFDSPGANKTGTYKLVMRGWDEANNQSIHEYTLFYTVAKSGNGLYSCYWSGTAPAYSGSGFEVPTPEEEAEIQQEPVTNNSLYVAFNNANNATGLGFTFLWFLLVIAVVIAVGYGLRGHDSSLVIGSMIMTLLFGIIMGAKLGFVSTGWIILLTIIMVISIAVMVSRKFMASSGGG